MSYWPSETVKVTERGWIQDWDDFFGLTPLFHRNSLVERYDGFGNCEKYIVATNGGAIDEDHNFVRFKNKPYYQTKIFCAENCAEPWAILSDEIILPEVRPLIFKLDDASANIHHDNVLQDFCIMLKKGYFEKRDRKIIYHPFPDSNYKAW